MVIPQSEVEPVRDHEEGIREDLIRKLPSGAGIFDVTGDRVFSVFLNDGYYRMIGCRREDREAFGQERVLQAILPEDIPGLIQEAKASIREGRLFHYRFRILNGQGQYQWTAVQASHEPLNEETERFYAAYTDADELVQAQRLLREREILLAETIRHSGTSCFLYFPKEHRYEAAAPSDVHQETSRVLEDYPESFIRLTAMMKEDAESYRRMIREIDGGAPEAECVVRMRMLGKYSWYRVHLSSIPDALGQTERAVGTSASIEGYRIAEADYRNGKLRMNTLQSDLLAVTCVNVTSDCVADDDDRREAQQDPDLIASAASAEPEIAVQSEETRNILLAGAAQIPDPQQRRVFLRTCSHAGLMRLYESGCQERTLEYRRLVNGRLLWVSTRIALRKDPDTGDVLAFFYTADIHERMLYRRITSQIMDRTFDSVAYVDLSRQMLCLRESGNDMNHLFREIPYEQAIDEAMTKYVIPEQRESVRAQYALDRIREQLKESSVCTIFYTSSYAGTNPAGGALVRMKSDIRYLDESRDILVILQIDVTEIYEQERLQREQEAETLRSREQARTLERVIRHIPGGLAVYSKKDGIIRIEIINEYLSRLAGMPEDLILNHDFDQMIRERIHPDDLKTAEEGMRRLFADGSASFTYRTRTSEGSYRWVTASGQTADEADGTQRAYVLYTDASYEKRQEEEYDAKIRELSSVNPNTIGVFHLNLTSNRLMRVQSQMQEYLHLSEEDTADSFIDKCIAGMPYEKDRIRCRSLISRGKLLEDLAARHFDLSCDFRYPRPSDGEIGWGTTYVYLAKNPRSGDAEAVFCTIDSTEASRGREIMARIAEDDYDFFALIDVSRRTIHFVNVRPQEKEYVPRCTDDYETDISRAIHAMSDPSDAGRCLEALRFDTIMAQLQKQPSYIFTFTIRDADGTEHRKQMRHEWLDETHDTILCTRVDVTAGYRQEQEQLRRMADALHAAESANQAKSQFLSRISHDIRTPLNAITSMTMFAREDAGRPEQLSQDLDRIETSSKFLLSLISDIMDISRIDSGNMELHPERYSYEEYRSSLISMFEPLCRQQGLTLLVPDGRHDGDVIADRIRLNQISLNLVSNAIRYSRPGGTITVETGSTLAPDGMLDCTLEVRDTGIGMSGEFQKIMFEPFTQEHDNPGRPARIGGTGLGLSLVRRITDLMGGTIDVASTLGKGTDITVRFRFPKAEPAAQEEPGDAAGTGNELLSGRVLLAEDNEINAEIAVRMIESFGLHAETAVNGREALQMLEQSEPGWYDLILMDIQMPLMNGYEAARAIRALPREDAHSVPIIALTADAFASDVQRSLEAGMNAHLAKPIDPQKMREVLTRFLSVRI